MLRPMQGKRILLMHFGDFLETAIGKVLEIHTQHKRFGLVNLQSTDLNGCRIQIFDIQSTFHPILIKTFHRLDIVSQSKYLMFQIKIYVMPFEIKCGFQRNTI